jgi:hypothetical protein
MTSARVRGHSLIDPFVVPIGRRDKAWCTCGWLSDPLDSDRARRQAHREHKDRVLARPGGVDEVQTARITIDPNGGDS